MRKGLRTAAYGGAGILALAFGIFIWGFVVEPRFVMDERYERIEIPGLPLSWDGKTVALIADLQAGLWFDNTRAARKAVRKIVQNHPAAVLLAGDFVYHSPRDLRREIVLVRALLRPLIEAGVPVVAVLGNHDYAMHLPTDTPDAKRAAKIRNALESIGIAVLDNDAIALTRSSQLGFDIPVPPSPLYIVGIGPHWPNRDRIAAALADVPPDAPRIALMHHPDSFENFPPRTAPLAVAGHTHGGQIRLPFTPEWTWMSYYREDTVHADGWVPDFGKPGNRLYVNRGIGCSIAPIRFNCPPELTFFTLKRAPAPRKENVTPESAPLMERVWIKVELTY